MPPSQDPTAEKKPKAWTMWRKPLTQDGLEVFYYAYKKYLSDGRQLDKDEVLGVMAATHDQSIMPKMNNTTRLFQVFDDPNDEFTLGYEHLTTKHAGNLERRVQAALQKYYRQYPQAYEFAMMVKGIPQRLDFPSTTGHGANWNDNYRIWKHQYIALYIIINWVRNNDESYMSLKDRTTIARKCIFDNQKGETSLMETLSNPKSQEATKWATLIEREKAKFVHNTGRLIESHEDRLKPDKIEWRIIPRHIHDVPPLDLPISTVTTATTAFEAMNLEATAGPGREPDDSDEARIRAIDADRDKWSRAPEAPPRPNTNDPYNVPGPHRQPGTSSTTSSYAPRAQGPPPVPPNPRRQSSQGNEPVSAMRASYLRTSQAQDPSSDPPNPHQQPPQGHGLPPTPTRLPSISQGFPPFDPATPPRRMLSQHTGPPSTFDQTVSQRQDSSRQSGDPKKRTKRTQDPDSSPKGSKEKKRRSDRGDH